MTAVMTQQSPLMKKKPKYSGVLLSFLFGCAVATAIFLPFLIVDKGFFLYCGDYNEQQIPFYLYVQNFIKEGGGQWGWGTDLGGSIINDYSYYNIGSPFLWLSTLFPNSWMPYLMVPMFILKFGCIAAAANLFLSRYAKTRNMAVICSIVYAFCGFNVYNIFFNSMLEPAIFFPLMLWALDGFMYDGQRGLFAVFVALALINNYFFFVGNVVFIVIYFVVKVACREYKVTLGRFGLLFFEAVLGVTIAMVLALPSLLSIVENPRTDNFANGMGLVLYGNVQQYFNILTNMFFPPDPPYLPNLFTEGAIKWTSMTAFLPVVGMGGVFAYVKSRKGGSIKKILFISLIMALVPILNSSFYAFNASYYARWYYMPMLFCCFATLRSLEDEDIDLEGGVRWALIFTAIYAIFGLLPTVKDDAWTLGVANIPVKFWLSLITALFMLALFYVIVRFYRHLPKFGTLLLAAVMGFSVFYSVIHLSLGKFPQWERDGRYKELQYDGLRNLDLPDDEGFYRLDTYEAHDNSGMWTGVSSIRTFNTTVAPSIMEFYPFVGVTRDVSSKPDTELYALRGLLSVKYTIVPSEKMDEFLAAPGVQGWSLLKYDGPYAIYQNDNFVPLGFTYDQYANMDTLSSVRAEDRGALLMRGIGLDEEQIARFGYLFEGEVVSWEQVTSTLGQTQTTENSYISYAPVDYTSYVQDCDARRAAASYQTAYDSSGFSSKIVLESENLVFYAVPYDKGWTATVNGQPAEVLKVSSGMMAVLAPAGDNTIVFTYETPGYRTGVMISLVGLVVLVAYMLLCWQLKRRRQGVAAATGAALNELPRAGKKEQKALGQPKPAEPPKAVLPVAPAQEDGEQAPPAPEETTQQDDARQDGAQQP